MSKPKSFDSWTPEKQDEWLIRRRETVNRSARKSAAADPAYRAKRNQQSYRSRDKRKASSPDDYKAMMEHCRERWNSSNPLQRKLIVNRSLVKHAEKYKRRKAIYEQTDCRRQVRRKKQASVREQITDSYLATAKGITVPQLRQYPRPVLEMWKALLILNRASRKTKNN